MEISFSVGSKIQMVTPYYAEKELKNIILNTSDYMTKVKSSQTVRASDKLGVVLDGNIKEYTFEDTVYDNELLKLENSKPYLILENKNPGFKFNFNGYNIKKSFRLLENAPKAWTVSGSDDLTTWTVLDTRSNIVWGNLETEKTFNTSVTGNHKYIKFEFDNITLTPRTKDMIVDIPISNRPYYKEDKRMQLYVVNDNTQSWALADSIKISDMEHVDGALFITKDVFAITTGSTLKVFTVNYETMRFRQLYEKKLDCLCWMYVDTKLNLWFMNRDDVNLNYTIHMYSAYTCEVLEIKFTNSVLEYDNVDISENVYVQTTTALGERISRSVKLTIVEGSATFDSTTNKECIITTEEDYVSEIPITVTNTGIVKIIGELLV